MDSDMKNNTQDQSTQRKKGLNDPTVWGIWYPQVCFGFSFTLLSFYIGYFHGDFILPSFHSSEINVTLSSRLAYALRCSFPMLLTLIGGIKIIGVKRGLTDAVNPLTGNEGVILVDKLYLSNTLEQFVVGLTLMLIIATYADSLLVLRLLPVFSTVFTIARVLFRVGYSYHGMYRATGMSMNFMGMYILIIIAAYHICTRSLTEGLSFPGLVLNSTLAATKGEL